MCWWRPPRFINLSDALMAPKILMPLRDQVETNRIAAAPAGQPPTLRVNPDGWSVRILDQTRLPHDVRFIQLRSADDAARAIVTMQVRGAPLIGVTAAYGFALALREDPSDLGVSAAWDLLIKTRPTAVNLRWALAEMRACVGNLLPGERVSAAYLRARELAAADVATNLSIGEHGLAILRKLQEKKRGDLPLQIMTHCNAGSLATLGWGTATAPMYLAHAAGLPIHVWVSETRPRNQGAALTAWELNAAGIPLTVVADNSAGHLIQRGLIDVVFVGADRVTAHGDAANKIGTYLKALAARTHKVPFYVAFPASTIDWTIADGVAEIPIEERSGDEVTQVFGSTDSGKGTFVRITPEGVKARNDAFDVTPARWITGLITERGVVTASAAGLRRLYPEIASKLPARKTGAKTPPKEASRPRRRKS